MTKKQYVKKRIIREVIRSDAIIMVAYLISLPLIVCVTDYIFQERIGTDDLLKKIILVTTISTIFLIVIFTILIALEGYWAKDKYEEEFDKMAVH